MHILAYMLAAVLVGVAVSIQPPMNAVMARAIGSPFGAATISIGLALATSMVLITFTGYGEITRARISQVPWWVYLAGIIGVIFVAGSVVIAPVTGSLIFFVCLIAGQLIGSAVSDHFGAFGLDIREISLARLGGIALVLAGAVLASNG